MGNPFQAGLREKYWGAYAQDDIRLAKGLERALRLALGALATGARRGRARFALLHAGISGGTHSKVYPNAPAGLQFYGDPDIPKVVREQQLARTSRRASVLRGIPPARATQSIRASYGVFFDTPESFTARDFGASAPWGNTISLTAPAGGLPIRSWDIRAAIRFPTPYPPSSIGFPGGRPIHYVPAEPAPHVSPAMGPELSAPDWRTTGW